MIERKILINIETKKVKNNLKFIINLKKIKLNDQDRAYHNV